LVALTTLVPLVVIGTSALGAGWPELSRLVFRPRTVELLANTGRLVVGSVAMCVVLGTGAAWLVTRTDLPLRRLWHVVMVAPLAVPAFVNAYAWSSLLPAADGFGGALIVVTLSYFPLVYLPVAATLRGLDPALAESAAALGLNPGAVFLRVTLPQLRPAVLGGSLLVALHLVAEFGALSLVRFPTLSTAVYDQFRQRPSGCARRCSQRCVSRGRSSDSCCPPYRSRPGCGRCSWRSAHTTPPRPSSASRWRATGSISPRPRP